MPVFIPEVELAGRALIIYVFAHLISPFVKNVYNCVRYYTSPFKYSEDTSSVINPDEIAPRTMSPAFDLLS